jgi:quercetin dioxygenase-like cupin family protein
VTFDLSAPGPRLVAARDVDPAQAPGHCFRVVADGAGTGGAYSLTEATSPAGAGVPFHAHDDAVECFYVLDGRYRLTVSGAEHVAGPGDFLLVPRGAPHGFEVLEGEAQALVLFAPAGFEEVFRRMPEIFGTPGEPGPVWEQANRGAGTRLLDAPGDGPGALVSSAATRAAGISRLAGPSATATGLDIAVRHDPRVGAAWSPEATMTAVCVLAGRYRLELPDQTLTAGAGDYICFPRATVPLWVIARAPDSTALLLSLPD